MGMFDERKKGLEGKFFHDEEMRFKATARRNRLLGTWAADRLGLKGPDSEAYAKEVVKADMAEAGDQDVIRKVLADFKAKGIASSEGEIAAKLDELMPLAAEQIEREAKP